MSYICSFKRDGVQLFFGYSTVSDRPETAAMTAEEFEGWYVEEQIERIRAELLERMRRAAYRGTSAHRSDLYSIEQLCECNRAGPEETSIPVAALLEQVVKDRTEWELPALPKAPKP